MKNLLPTCISAILFIFVLNYQSAIAQISSNAIFVNGNFSFNDKRDLIAVNRKPYNRLTETIRNQLQLNSSLGVGYTFLNRLVIGGAFNYNFRNDEYGDVDINRIKRDYHTFTWGPFGRLYIINKKAGLFTDLKYLKGNHADIGGYNADEIQKGTLSIVSYGIGGNYFLTKQLSVEVLASYQKEKRIGELKPNTDPSSNTRVSTNSKTVQVNFGIAYLIKP